ncbi:hypothetical protein [Parendozoicomonas haliclonae]|uniref:Uncharacterized protein n=1 Tax=Parendozoicomonas haliclonae TaxID=1960125 RepID=A0A1X7AP91_9GAMM|nr:hypothetical protein [Parendozoicomonas haliclonae]SMA50141.1 hypothetical protein EHSB41UT_03932 [Parendozoicomonas haliclonae]
MNKVLTPNSTPPNQLLDLTAHECQPSYPSIKTCCGSSLLGALVNRILFRQVSIDGRKVRLMRHIPLLGTIGLFKWESAQNLFPKPTECNQLAQNDLMLRTPHCEGAQLYYNRESSHPYGAQGGIQFAEGRPDLKGTMLRLIKVMSVSLTAIGLSTFFLPQSFLLTPILGGMHLVMCIGCISTYAKLEQLPFATGMKGVLLKGMNTYWFRQEVQRLEQSCESNAVRFEMLSNNCASAISRVLKESVPPEYRGNVGGPLFFSTPIDTLIVANNVNAIMSAVRGDNFS